MSPRGFGRQRKKSRERSRQYAEKRGEVRKTSTQLLLMALGALLGCDDGTAESGHAAADVEAGCAHFEFGPFVEVNAGVDDNLPELPRPHTRYNIRLANEEGAVLFTPPAAQRYILLLGTDVPLAIADASGATIEPAVVEKAPISACAAAAAAYHVDLGLETFSFTLPSGGTTIALVVHQPMVHATDGGHGGP